jgi:hypothetical protein
VYEYLFGNRASEWMNTRSDKMIINIYCAIHARLKTIWQQLISNVKVHQTSIQAVPCKISSHLLEHCMNNGGKGAPRQMKMKFCTFASIELSSGEPTV